VVAGRPGPARRGPGAWLWAWGPAIAWALLIFSASSLSRPPSPPGGITDKHEHVVAYGVLSAFVLRGLSGATMAGVTAGTAGGAAAIATLYGMSDEFHQRFVPERDASWLDLGADVLGASAAAGLVYAWAIIRRR
jgi:VanZ family protein